VVESVDGLEVACPNCGQGRLEPIATILDPDVIARILAAMDRFARAPRAPPA
jgi:hypothetical protein